MDAKRSFWTSVVALNAGVFMSSAHADTFSFDTDAAGSLPPGWEQGVDAPVPLK